MPIAKEQIKIGFTVIANPGTYISQSAVDQYGWQDKVDPDPAPVDPATTQGLRVRAVNPAQ